MMDAAGLRFHALKGDRHGQSAVSVSSNSRIVSAAEGLGATRKALSELVNAHTDISRDMAIRLAKAFPNTDIRFWLDLQLQYDTLQADQRAPSIKVTPFQTQTTG